MRALLSVCAFVACTSTSSTTPPFTCPAGSTACSGSCVVTVSDPQNCGACGTTCPTGQVCTQGQCALDCAGGATKCGTVCTDTKIDSQNCGACDAACPAEEYCSASKCGTTCGAGTSMCDAGCVDTNSDRFNCGGCGNTCDTANDCVDASCELECQQGLTLCATPDAGLYPSDGGDAAMIGPNLCTDTQIDPYNCGTCGIVCALLTPKCSKGACIAADAGN